jgi:hypothetical protein
MYDAELGRFVSEDPARDGANWYVYAGGNPGNAVDPWGLEKAYVYLYNSTLGRYVDTDSITSVADMLNQFTYALLKSGGNDISVYSYAASRMQNLNYTKGMGVSTILSRVGLADKSGNNKAYGLYFQKIKCKGAVSNYWVNGPALGSSAYTGMVSQMIVYHCDLANNPYVGDTTAAVNRVMRDVNNHTNLSGITDSTFRNLGMFFSGLVPDTAMTSDIHYFRNKLNRAPATLNAMVALNDALPESQKWRLYSLGESLYHINDSKYLLDKALSGDFNLKFVSADGMYEAVYDKSGTLLTQYNDPVNMGTFNYGNNYTGGALAHFELDMVPYGVLNGTGMGNVPGGRSTSKPLSAVSQEAKDYRDNFAKNIWTGRV